MLRTQRKSVGAATFIPNRGAKRSLTWALVASPSACHAASSLLVTRAHGCTRSGRRSVKILRRQVVVLQKNLRTDRTSFTCRPAQGRSATQRV